MTKQTYLVMRMVDRTMGTDHRDRVFDSSTARMNPDMAVAMTRSGAWTGSVFGVWSIDAGTSRTQAIKTAYFMDPDQAFVLTELGWLAELNTNEFHGVGVVELDEDGE